MLRVCGADGEQTRFAQRQCWCKGLFCGRGGARLSQAFRRVMRRPATASSREEFLDLCGQADLFAGDELRHDWIARVDDAQRRARG